MVRSNQELCSDLLQLIKRRDHGKWMPLAYWSNKINDTDVSKLKKALDKQAMVGVELVEHDSLYLELVPKTIDVSGKQKRTWFLCCSVGTPVKKEMEDPVVFKALLQRSWNQYHNRVGLATDGTTTQQEDKDKDDNEPEEKQEDDALEDQHNQQLSTDYQSPPLQSRVTPPTTIGSPALQDDGLLLLFRSLVNPKYLSAEDLLIDSSPEDVRSKIKAFGTKAASKSNNKHYKQCRALFKEEDDIAFEREKIQDIDPNDYPFFTNRCHIPLTLSAMRDLTQSLINLSERVPEVLYLNKYAGSKGQGGRLVAVVPSANKKRLYDNAKTDRVHIVSSRRTFAPVQHSPI